MKNSSIGLSKITALRRELAIKIYQEGFGGTLRMGGRRIIRELGRLCSGKKQQLHEFDLKHGTDTTITVPVGALDLPEDRLAHAVKYGTAIVEVFTGMLRELAIPYEEFAFIDLGSGKGRALLLASAYPFKSIVGIELSPRLHEIACRNISIYKDESQKCHNIRSVCEDATAYSIPHEKAVFYLFNPFDGEVMRAVLGNIQKSLAECPRTIFIVYLKPVHRCLFDQAEFLRLTKQTQRYLVYQGGPPCEP